MAVKSVDDSPGPDDFLSTISVYGAPPRLGLRSDPPTPSNFKLAVAKRDATQEILKHFSRRQLNVAVRSGNGLDTSDINTGQLTLMCSFIVQKRTDGKVGIFCWTYKVKHALFYFPFPQLHPTFEAQS